MSKDYTVSDIKVMEGLEAVRMRPGMYIGSTGARGLHHMLWEIVDNAVDEAANGFADTINVTLNKDNSVTVEDNGRGIPVGIHEKLGVSGVEVVYTQLHAGGKFDNDAYGFSGGLHGVGASVVNALSEYVIVEVATEGKSYIQRFHSYVDADGVTHSGIPEGPLQETGRTRKRGTRVTFLPDRRVFETLDMNFEIISKRLRELAYLNRGVRFNLTDERTRGDKKEREYCFEGGLSDFVKYLNADKTPLYPEPIHISGTKDGIVVELAMQHNDGYTESMFSYVNNIPTTEGGTHETGFKSALTKIMNDYCRKSGLLKEKDASLSGEDFREGLTVVLALKMHSVQFEGQTKTRLGNTEAKPAVEFVMNEFLTPFLEDLKNSETASLMADKAIKAAKVRESARKAKSMAREKNKLDNAPLVGKLSSCTGRDYKINELFIVEGDSAGGSAKMGRDPAHQAILPLRGKILNVEKTRMDKILANNEIRAMITAFGAGIDEEFDTSKLRYHKIVCMTDADVDGSHIRILMLTFFFRHMRPLIEQGYVYVAQPPLYRITKGKNIYYAYDDEELNSILERIGRDPKPLINRYKGLGEMNPEQLWETTMDPERRVMLQVHLEDAMKADEIFSVLMGDKVEPRREFIENNSRLVVDLDV